jgi:uncharacterized membrane protein YwaF
MARCDKARSLAVGFMTALVMGLVLLLWFGVDVIRQTMISRSDILLIFVLLWAIGSSMDYFDQCYTECTNLRSSVKYGTFVVALIYLVFVLFIGDIQLSMRNLVAFLLNVVIITGLHYVSCEITHKTK